MGSGRSIDYAMYYYYPLVNVIAHSLITIRLISLWLCLTIVTTIASSRPLCHVESSMFELKLTFESKLMLGPFFSLCHGNLSIRRDPFESRQLVASKYYGIIVMACYMCVSYIIYVQVWRCEPGILSNDNSPIKHESQFNII